MSRIGKMPIAIPSGVSIEVQDGVVVVNGTKGSLSQPLLANMTLEVTPDAAILKRSSEDAMVRAQHGLMRALIANMVQGVSQGFERQLEVNGVGFRVSLAGNELHFQLGFSHEIVYKLPEGISAVVNQNQITVNGISKQLVGQTAADIRALKKPEPYKGKGIAYVGERILRKSGKSGKEK